MAGQIEIIFNFEKINEALTQLQALQNRAISCSRRQFYMTESQGDSMIAMTKTYEAVSVVAKSTAIMIEHTINKINEAALDMKEKDAELSQTIKASK